jgi:DNA primase
VRRLADRAGHHLHEDAEIGPRPQAPKVFLDAMERAVVWYHERLLRAPDAGLGPGLPALAAATTGDVVRQFRLGWAPDEWDALSRP